MHDSVLPKLSRVVICGAGIIGNSVAYHLVRRGWTDVLVLEKGRIGCGATWRSSAMVSQLCPTVGGITACSSVLLYQQLQDAGHNIGWKPCGSLYIARTHKRMVSLLRLSAEAKARGVECVVQQPKALRNCHPYIRTEDLVGGVFLPSDGIVDPMALCQTLAQLSQEGGAKYVEQCSVHRVLTENGAVTSVETSLGNVQCEHFVLAGGMWSRELAQASHPKFAVPIHAAKQSFGITKPVDGLPESLPVLRDYDGRMYCHKYGEASFLVGGYEEMAKPLFHYDVPDRFEFLRLAPDYAQFEPIFGQFQQRCPLLQNLELAELVTAPETFTPDAQCILGETSEVEKLYLAVGMNGAQAQWAGGVGRVLSRWVVSGAPQAHLLPWDPRRFIELHNNCKFLKERVQESVGRRCIPPHPLQSEWHTARGLRCSPLLPLLQEYGAATGERMGFERALYFDPSAPKGSRLTPESTFGRPPWLDNVHEEYIACRERVGISDMSSFSKFYLESGSMEVVDFLQKLCSNDVDVPIGHVVQTGMQNERGGYENDCILVRTHHNRYFMVSPTAQQTRIGKWVQRHLPHDGSVSLRDVTSLYTVLYILGPKSRSLLEEVTGANLHLQPFSCQEMDVAYASSVLVLSYNNTLEPGYSLYVPSEFALHVYNRLMKVGQDYGIMNVGYYTLRFLRIEKFVPFWAEELDSSITPLEANRSARIKLQKDYFIGKFALQEEAEKGLLRQLAFFQLRDHDPDSDPWAWGQEPIFRDGRFVGITTSGGHAFTLGCNVCQGFVENRNPSTGILEPLPRNYVDGGKFEIELAKRRYPAVASVLPPRLSVAPMGGLHDHYKPQVRFSN